MTRHWTIFILTFFIVSTFLSCGKTTNVRQPRDFRPPSSGGDPNDPTGGGGGGGPSPSSEFSRIWGSLVGSQSCRCYGVECHKIEQSIQVSSDRGTYNLEHLRGSRVKYFVGKNYDTGDLIGIELNDGEGSGAVVRFSVCGTDFFDFSGIKIQGTFTAPFYVRGKGLNLDCPVASLISGKARDGSIQILFTELNPDPCSL